MSDFRSAGRVATMAIAESSQQSPSAPCRTLHVGVASASISASSSSSPSARSGAPVYVAGAAHPDTAPADNRFHSTWSDGSAPIGGMYMLKYSECPSPKSGSSHLPPAGSVSSAAASLCRADTASVASHARST